VGTEPREKEEKGGERRGKKHALRRLWGSKKKRVLEGKEKGKFVKEGKEQRVIARGSCAWGKKRVSLSCDDDETTRHQQHICNLRYDR